MKKNNFKTGKWITAGGSCLDLKVNLNGQVTGFYSSSHGQPKSDEKFPITGFINEDLIGFVCSWEKYKSMTSWCGRYTEENGKPCIKTVWHLGRMFSDKEHLVPTTEASFTFLTYSGKYFLKEK